MNNYIYIIVYILRFGSEVCMVFAASTLIIRLQCVLKLFSEFVYIQLFLRK